MITSVGEIIARYTTTLDAPLRGDVPLDDIIQNAPAAYTVKGMFFTRYAADVGSAWSEVAKQLQRPPPDGRYSSFAAYPLGDYLRIFGRAAQARFPGATREAFRLLARGEVDVFAESTFGKVTLSLIDNPATAIDQFPRVLGVLSRGFACAIERPEDGSLVIRFPRYAGVIEVVLGLLEGIILIFDLRPSIDVERDAAGTVSYTVSWSED